MGSSSATAWDKGSWLRQSLQSRQRQTCNNDAPSASPAADADNVEDGDARVTKEDDGNNKMLGTSKVRGVGTKPATPTIPNPCHWGDGSGLTACCPMQQCCSGSGRHPTVTKGIAHSSTYANFPHFCMRVKWPVWQMRWASGPDANETRPHLGLFLHTKPYSNT